VPSGLETFLRTPNEHQRATAAAGVPTYSRTPAFAWNPVRGANRYEFVLSTSGAFSAQNAVIWSAVSRTPAASVPIALPWITGEPASLYWRVRAIGPGGVSYWSEPHAFNMRWTEKPKQLSSGPGFVRWSTVSGATGYQVWFVTADKVIETMTNVADEREYFLIPSLPGNAVHWRVRAERQLYGSPANGLPAVSYGPWSPTFTSTTPDNPLDNKYTSFGPLSAVSDVTSSAAHPLAHSLFPATTVGGNPTSTGNLYRLYLFTDRDCVNRVYSGYPVASPAYAPRTIGGETTRLLLSMLTGVPPELLSNIPPEKHLTVEGTEFVPSEIVPKDAAAAAPAAGTTTRATTTAASSTPATPAPVARAKVDLWDSNWPRGRYFSAVVPVRVYIQKDFVVFQDTELPQDECSAGRTLAFGKWSKSPVLLMKGAPSATGLSPSGRLLSAVEPKPKFYGSPLVTWDPASGAVGYQVEWSRSSYPWRSAGSIRTPATSAMLPLAPGTWYYRVRGINDSLRGNQMMSWSAPTSIVITRPSFKVVRG
jgi:hypothetical protein